MNSKFSRAIAYAANKIMDWEYWDQVSAIYLYGSLARQENRSDSDIDLYVELLSPVPPREIRKLKTEVMPEDWILPDIDIKTGVLGFLDQDDLFHRNIKQDGVILWKKK